MEKGNSSRVGTCFRCGDPIHWKSECPWSNYSCYLGCGTTMKLYTSNVDGTRGEKFFGCNGQVHGCRAFRWLKDAQAMLNDTKQKQGGKLKLTINGAVPMSVEGDVCDITELVKNLSMSK
ncbi:hypothetical protein ACHQM5_000758 [Ranunculus cassubicifolius]